MRRKECERDAAFAWEVLKNSIYSTVSMVCPDGTPYATPVNIIGDEVYNALYFHCAGAGERWELLKNGAPVCVTAVSTATLLPNQFTTAYRSAMFRGRAQVVTDEGEKMKAMLLLCTAFDPQGYGALRSGHGALPRAGHQNRAGGHHRQGARDASGAAQGPHLPFVIFFPFIQKAVPANGRDSFL